jgi:hypothetical protein
MLIEKYEFEASYVGSHGKTPFIFQPYPVYNIHATLGCRHVVNLRALFSKGYLCQTTLLSSIGKEKL